MARILQRKEVKSSVNIKREFDIAFERLTELPGLYESEKEKFQTLQHKETNSVLYAGNRK